MRRYMPGTRGEMTKREEKTKAKVQEREGSIMQIAKRDVVTIPPTMTIMDAARKMVKKRFRRLPVVDPGSGRLMGVVGSSDVIDFLGGGRKFKIIEEKCGGNFLVAINRFVREIMATEVMTLDPGSSIEDALNMLLSSRVGGLLVVDEEGIVKGIVTEKDFVSLVSGKVTDKTARDYMTEKVVTAEPDATLGDITKLMVKNSFRRVPILKDGDLQGVITTRTILELIGESQVFEKLVENRVEEVLGIKAEELMSRRVLRVLEDVELGEVAELVDESALGTVFVVEDSKLKGILTERDIVRYMAE